MHHVHSMVLELQSKHEKLVQTTAELVNEYNRREKSLEELYNSVDRLEQNKADKEHVNQEIGIKVGKDKTINSDAPLSQSLLPFCSMIPSLRLRFFLIMTII